MDSSMRSIAVIDDDFRVLESLQNLLASFATGRKPICLPKISSNLTDLPAATV
jgi:hypothetical protein